MYVFLKKLYLCVLILHTNCLYVSSYYMLTAVLSSYYILTAFRLAGRKLSWQHEQLKRKTLVKTQVKTQVQRKWEELGGGWKQEEEGVEREGGQREIEREAGKAPGTGGEGEGGGRSR